MGIQIPLNSLADVLSAMTSMASRGLGAEKRRATRIRIEAQVTLWPMVDGTPDVATTGMTRDLSYSGVGLLVARKLQVGDQFLLRLPRTKDQPLLLRCQVTFAAEMAENLYGVGAEFINALDKQKEPEATASKVVDAARTV